VVNTNRRSKTARELAKENQGLRARLAEAEETLRAIRGGEVDAFLVHGAEGDRVLALEGAESAYRALVEAMNEGAAILNDGETLVYCNSRLATMLDSPLETVIGASLFRYVAPAEKERVERLLERGKAETCTGDFAFCRQDGTAGPVHLSLSPMQIHGLPAIGVIATDLTERNRLEELRRLSLLDELTGLLNRRGFLGAAQQNLKLARRLKESALLLFIDLDGLKDINDNLGHTEGDRALADSAVILKDTYRDSDIVARLGGDEFTVLAMGTPERDSGVLASRLQRQLDAHNAKGHRPYQLSMSVGIVGCGPENSMSIEDLIARADAAMYENKRSKRMSFLVPPAGPVVAPSLTRKLA
jgi:diguanylate cyclase (GGDEF)-like protein/PAS domain S-box-containing protein